METLEYVWTDPKGNFRSKLRHVKLGTKKESLIWSYDGSSVGVKEVKDSEVVLKPYKKRYVHPFIKDAHILFCNAPPLEIDDSVWVAFEQEYFLTDKNGKPLSNAPQGQFYCGVGAQNTPGRKFAQAHYGACLIAGIRVSGMNAEVAPGQWEIQVGHGAAYDTCVDLMIARFLLFRLTEYMPDFFVKLHPKPFKNLNGSGLHTNISTKLTRDPLHGLEHIYKIIKGAECYHNKMISVCGKDNDKRMCGKFEAPDKEKYSWGVSDRTASIRIPKLVEEKGFGYFEDRRPGSNANPFKILEVWIPEAV